ncbi:MAG: LL-diaminopimelate aminotransferase, partial [Methanobrevibacter wolinii]
MVVKVNENYLLLKSNYLFAEVANRVAKFEEENPDIDLIAMGIGDVTKPLPKTVIKAFKDAVDEMGDSETFRGYGPEHGYEFLREAIIKGDYEPLGVSLDVDEIF